LKAISAVGLGFQGVRAHSHFREHRSLSHGSFLGRCRCH